MAQSTKTFRVFVSSPFSDLKAERNALQQYVFPKLRELCLQRCCRFQAIDLRWGVSEEAALDQQTMKICLKEIARCQEVTPRPNFIVLLGDRYGWRPLPAEIPADEFAAIKRQGTSEADLALLDRFYHLDENALHRRRPDDAPVGLYCLRRRKVIDPFAATDQEKEAAREAEAAEWRLVESQLRRILLDAVASLHLRDGELAKYYASATEQEIMRGAMNVADAEHHVSCFFRSLLSENDRPFVEDLPHEDAIEDFIDLDDDGSLDRDAHYKLRDLKTRLRERLGTNVHEYNAHWLDSGGGGSQSPITLDHIGTLPQDLDECLTLVENGQAPALLCVDVWCRLARVILDEIAQIESVSPVQREKEEHEKFGKERAKHFIGRGSYLEAINQYVNADDQSPFALWGESGSGKSALLTRVAERIHEANPNAELVVRFIGATPQSSDVRALLESLCHEISGLYGAEQEAIPADYNGLVKEFPKRLALATKQKPLVLIVDALDQISDAEHGRNLNWLPTKLPENARLIVSTIPGKCLDVLQRKLPSENISQLEAMPKSEGGEVLDLWLRDASRTLQNEQRGEVLNKFAANGLPLYLKLAFEEARLWHSYDAVNPLAADVPGIISNLFERLSDQANHGAVMVSRSLGYLAAARNGLTEDEILSVLSSDDEVMGEFKRRSVKSPAVNALPGIVWSRLYFDLEPYLTERSADNTSLLSFYHRQLGEVTAQKYLTGADEQRAHKHLADYFDAQDYWLESPEQYRNRVGEFPASARRANLRKAVEFPWQLRHVGDWDRLEQVHTTLDFLESKTAAGLVFELAQDFAEAIKIIPSDRPLLRIVRLLEEALRRDIHFIARHREDYPQALFQCMWNSCWWYDCPEAAKHFNSPEGGWSLEGSPWERPGPKLYVLLESWRRDKEGATPGLSWVRSLRPYPPVSGASRVVVLRGHSCPVQCVDFSPDGSQIVSGSAHLGDEGAFSAAGIPIWHGGKRIAVSTPVVSPYPTTDNSVRVWDSWSGEQLECFSSQDGPINCCTFSPDGEHIAYSGSRRGTVQIIQAVDGAAVGRFEGHKATVSRVVYSPDGRRLASASWDGTIRIREAKTGADIACLRGHNAAVIALAFSPDGKLIASGSGSAGIPGDNSLRIWDATAGLELHCVERPRLCGVMSVAFSPDGRWVVAGSTDHKVLLYAVANGFKEEVLGTHRGEVLSVAFGPRGDRVVSGATDFTARVWDVLERREVACLRGHQDFINSVTFSPDGRRIASGSADQTVRVWDTAFEKDSAHLNDHEIDIVDLAFSAGGERILSASRDGTLRFWDFGGLLLQVFADHPLVRKIAISRDGGRIFSTDNRVIRIRPTSGGEVQKVGYRSDNVDITDFIVSDDGAWLIGGSWDGKIRVWNAVDGSEACCLFNPNDEPVGLSFLAQENRIIYAQEITALALSPDGRHIASGSADGTVRLWKLAGGSGLGHREHLAAVSCIAFSSDRNSVASGAADGEIVLWSPFDGTSPTHIAAHSEAVVRIAFGFENKSLFSASATQTARITELDAPQMEVLEGSADVFSIAKDRTGTKPWVLAGDLETTVRSATGQAVAWFPAALSSLRAHPNGMLWTGAENNHLHLFTLEGSYFKAPAAGPPTRRTRVVEPPIANRGRSRLAPLAEKETFEIPDGTIPESMVPSPDASRAAYIVRELGCAHVEINGRRQRNYDDIAGLTWSADSARVAYAAMRNYQWFVVCDDREVGPYGEIGKTSPVFSPDAKRLAYTTKQGWQWFAVVDGEIVGGPYEGFAAGGILFSPDSKKVAYVIKRGNAWVVVVDGKDYRSYHSTLERSLVFSPDSKHFAYIGCAYESGLFSKRTKAFLVLDGKPGPMWDHDERSSGGGVSAEVVFSPDSQRIAYAVRQIGRWSWIVDGIPGPSHEAFVSGWGADPNWMRFPDHGKTCCRPDTLTFSPDSRHFAYAARDHKHHALIYDGDERGRHAAITNTPVLFSPDSARVAYAAEEGGHQFMVVGGVSLKQHYGVAGDRCFSPDSTQLAYVCIERPGNYHLAVGAKLWLMSGGPLVGARLLWDDDDHLHTLVGSGRRITVVRYRVR